MRYITTNASNKNPFETQLMLWHLYDSMDYKVKVKDYFQLDTSVENMFINEYMVSAPGDFVKVYLFALMYCNLGSEFTNEDIAKHLNLDYEDVLKAWTYWEKMGVIRKIKDDPDD